MALHILIPVADGVEELEAVTIIDILRRAGAQVVVAGISKKDVIASRGVKITADTVISDCIESPFDAIILPGGVPGVEHLRDCEALITCIKQHNLKNKLIGAICAAPQVVLAHHGILKTQRATGHPAFTERILNRDALDQRVVVDGNVITSRGAGTALEFSLKLVEIMYGRSKAFEIATAIVAAPGIV